MRLISLLFSVLVILPSLYSQHRGANVAIGFGNSIQGAAEITRDDSAWLTSTYNEYGKYGAESRFDFSVDGQSWNAVYYLEDGELYLSSGSRIIIYDVVDFSKSQSEQGIILFKARSVSVKYLYAVLYIDSGSNNNASLYSL